MAQNPPWYCGTKRRFNFPPQGADVFIIDIQAGEGPVKCCEAVVRICHALDQCLRAAHLIDRQRDHHRDRDDQRAGEKTQAPIYHGSFSHEGIRS